MASSPLHDPARRIPHRRPLRSRRLPEKRRRRWPRLAAWRRLLRTHPRLRRTLYALGGVFALFLAVTLWLLFPYLKAFGDIGAGPGNAPSRLYGAAAEIRVGDETSPAALADELEALGYRDYEGEGIPAGRFRALDDELAVRLRRHRTPEGPVPGQLLLVQFRRRKVSEIRADGQPVERIALEAPGPRHLLRRGARGRSGP